MTIQAAFTGIVDTIKPVHDTREAVNIAHLVMEHITGLGKLDRIVHKDGDLTPAQETQYQEILASLLAHRPVQYITGKSWFYGIALQVNEHVLIPRPETEELVEWILLDHPTHPAWRLLDVGTGSGCIPIALKKFWPAADIWAMDVSPAALTLAARNAGAQHTPIRFLQQDVLSSDAAKVLPSFNIIVSNPPYIRESEKTGMQKQVVDFEPSLALFVPGDDALLFYRRIAALALEKLEPGGKLYFEINESLGMETADMLRNMGYENVRLKQDMFGKDRMIRAIRK